MAIYDRSGASSVATASIPSRDLSSVIVQSLQNAVESIKGENSEENSLSTSIQQGIDNSSIMKSLNASSSKISESFKKTNTKAQGDKNSPSEKVSKNMDDITGLLKADDKREKERDKETKVINKTEKKHKTSVKEGFSAVKVFGNIMLQKIGLILLGVQVLAELIVLLKYGWHYLMGVFIPNTWTKIKLAWTGFWTKITTEIRNFFVGLFRPIFTKFGIELGLSDEQIKRKAELAKEITDSGGGERLKALADTRKTATQSLNEIESRLKGSDYEYLLTYLNADELREKISKGENITQDINKWQTQWLSGAISGAQSKGDSGNVDRLQSIDSSLTKMLNSHDFKSVADAYTNMQAFLRENPDMASKFEEYKALEKGLVDVDAAVRNAQIQVYKQDLEQGDISVKEYEAMKKDKKYGSIAVAAVNALGGEKEIQWEAADKHETWLDTYGKEWVDSMKTMVNDLTQNIGINLKVGQEKEEESSIGGRK